MRLNEKSDSKEASLRPRSARVKVSIFFELSDGSSYPPAAYAQKNISLSLSAKLAASLDGELATFAAIHLALHRR